MTASDAVLYVQKEVGPNGALYSIEENRAGEAVRSR